MDNDVYLIRLVQYKVCTGLHILSIIITGYKLVLNAIFIPHLLFFFYKSNLHLENNLDHSDAQYRIHIRITREAFEKYRCRNAITRDSYVISLGKEWSLNFFFNLPRWFLFATRFETHLFRNNSNVIVWLFFQFL